MLFDRGPDGRCVGVRAPPGAQHGGGLAQGVHRQVAVTAVRRAQHQAARVVGQRGGHEAAEPADGHQAGGALAHRSGGQDAGRPAQVLQHAGMLVLQAQARHGVVEMALGRPEVAGVGEEPHLLVEVPERHPVDADAQGEHEVVVVEPLERVAGAARAGRRAVPGKQVARAGAQANPGMGLVATPQAAGPAAHLFRDNALEPALPARAQAVGAGAVAVAVGEIGRVAPHRVAEGGHQQGAAVTDRVQQRVDHSRGAAVHRSQCAQAAVHHHRRAGPEAQVPEFRAELRTGGRRHGQSVERRPTGTQAGTRPVSCGRWLRRYGSV